MKIPPSKERDVLQADCEGAIGGAIVGSATGPAGAATGFLLGGVGMSAGKAIVSFFF